MSAGHKLSLSIPSTALNLLQKVQLHPVNVSHDYNVPYLGGTSQDGRTIYIDSHLPSTLKVGDQHVDVAQFIQIHEQAERSLMDQGLPYAQAHALATVVEHRSVIANGLNPIEYEKALRPYIRGAEHEKLTNPPPDLDLRPYQETHPQHLAQALKRG